MRFICVLPFHTFSNACNPLFSGSISSPLVQVVGGLYAIAVLYAQQRGTGEIACVEGFACTAVSYSMSAAPTAVGNTTKVSAAFRRQVVIVEIKVMVRAAIGAQVKILAVFLLPWGAACGQWP